MHLYLPRVLRSPPIFLDLVIRIIFLKSTNLYFLPHVVTMTETRKMGWVGHETSDLYWYIVISIWIVQYISM